MKYQTEKISMVKALSDAPGASGFEDEVLTVVRRELGDLCRFEEDCLRNLYIYRRNHSGSKPVLMLDAHSDEVGFVIHSIRPNGTLRFVTLGKIDPRIFGGSSVLVRTADGAYIPGTIGLKPPHFAADGEGKSLDIHDFSIDVGACSAGEAREAFRIAIGEPAVPATKCVFDEQHGLFYGKAFDCRIGVAALIDTLRRLDGKELPFDVVGVISAQEEVGERGIPVAVRKVNPDIAICFEGCPADDTTAEPYAVQTALHKGPMFRFMDRSVICSPRFQRFMLCLAEERGIPAQASVREGGGNNGVVIQRSGSGVPVVVAGVPVRYSHSMTGIAAYDDMEHTAALAAAAIEALTPEIVSGF